MKIAEKKIQNTEAVAGNYFVKRVLLTILQSSQENLCRRLFFIRLQTKALQIYQKKTPALVLSCEFTKSLRTLFIQKTSTLLLLKTKLLSTEHGEYVRGTKRDCLWMLPNKMYDHFLSYCFRKATLKK